MANTPATLPGLGSSEERDVGQIYGPWYDPTYIETEANSAYASPKQNYYSFWLRASQFGFSIPAGSTIDGIKVEINHYALDPYIRDDALYLVNGSGVNVGNNKASAAIWGATPATITYGGATDKWNASPTVAMVNDSDFGIRLSIWNTYELDFKRGYVSWVKITVYYTPPAVAEHRRASFFKMF